MQATNRGQRFGPLYLPVDEEVETNHLKFLVTFPGINCISLDNMNMYVNSK